MFERLGEEFMGLYEALGSNAHLYGAPVMDQDVSICTEKMPASRHLHRLRLLNSYTTIFLHLSI